MVFKKKNKYCLQNQTSHPQETSLVEYHVNRGVSNRRYDLFHSFRARHQILLIIIDLNIEYVHSVLQIKIFLIFLLSNLDFWLFVFILFIY